MLEGADRRAADRLTRELAEMRTRLDRAEAGLRSVQLANSSIEDGSVGVHDADGVERARLGVHTDGTVALTYANGPAPPTPTAPTLIAVELGLVIYWPGTFTDSEPRPADVARIDIHEAELAGFTADGSTIKSSLPAEGARLLVLDNQTHHVKLVAVTTSGVASAPSAEVSATPLPVSDLDADALTGKTITGATVQTASSAPSIVLNPNQGFPRIEVHPDEPDGDTNFNQVATSSGNGFVVRSRQDSNGDFSTADLTGTDAYFAHLREIPDQVYSALWLQKSSVYAFHVAGADPANTQTSIALEDAVAAVATGEGSTGNVYAALEATTTSSTMYARDGAGGPIVGAVVADGSGVRIGSDITVGTPIKGIDFGNGSYAFDSSGVAVINHNLGVTPASVIVSADNADLNAGARVFTSTSFEVSLTHVNGTAQTDVSRFLSWVALA